MSSEKGIILKVDKERRIGIDDVINMLKGLRDETFFEVVKTSQQNSKPLQNGNISSFSNADKEIKSNHVTGNIDLPQIRELNEIAALLRSMDNLANSFEN